MSPVDLLILLRARTIPLTKLSKSCGGIRRAIPGMRLGPGVNLERGAPLDITLARDQLGYEPKYDLESGVRAYRAWFDSQSA
jgi:nucleoside-diphosphate-sugar epimerase